MYRSFQSVLCAALTVFALSAAAQDKAPAAAPAVKSVNIQDVKPDASDAPGYAEQTNAERGTVQPGNNAPMWRGVGCRFGRIDRVRAGLQQPAQGRRP
jgi:formate dehydrogenase subunit gamma